MISNSHPADAGSGGRLAQEVCEAIEKGDSDRLEVLLDLKSFAISMAIPEQPARVHDSQPSNTKVYELLRIFYHLIGQQHSEEDIKYHVSVQAHLLLKALLQVSSIDVSLCLVSWQAATATIKSLQFLNNLNASITRTTHSEELRMIADIRSFLSFDLLAMLSAANGAEKKLELINHLSEQLLLFGEVITDPLLRTDGRTGESYSMISSQRRQTYLLPLELIPYILSVTDTLDDAHVEISDDLARQNFALGLGLTKTGSDDLHIKQNEEQSDNQSGGEEEQLRKQDKAVIKKEDIKVGQIETKENDEGRKSRASETILTTIFASFGRPSYGTRNRLVRADAVLPILALAIDDIGDGHMSSLYRVGDGVSTYWICLRQTLDFVISSSVRCCTEKEELDTHNENDLTMRERIEKDEGVLIIPHSDYPALLRCIFRMITSENLASSQNQRENPTWESLLLCSYHSSIITTLSPIVLLSDKHRKIDRMSILSTVESHVLHPAFTEASVASIKSMLGTCTIEFCGACRRSKPTTNVSENNAVPSFAIARFVLLVMQARTSTVSHSLTNNAAGFGPRSVFQMASKILHKDIDCNGEQIEVERRFHDEVEMALKVLLKLSEIDSGICPLCSNINTSSEAEIAAYEVLKCSFYRESKFSPRFQNSHKEVAYRSEVGLRTLLSYTNLVRSSLVHGLRGSSEKHHIMESFILGTARTWLDVAMILIDDYSKLSHQPRRTNCKRDGSASITFAAVIVVVIFCEIQSSQRDIIQSLYDRIISSSLNNCCDEAILSIISVLTGSISFRDNDVTTSIEVFSRKNDWYRLNMSIFEPLCSLLSRPVVSNEQKYGLHFATDGTAPLSHTAMMQIAKSLISVPSARERILSIAKKHMRVLTLVGSRDDPAAIVNPFFESVPCTQAANRDAVYLSVACLCMLVENHWHLKRENENMDDCCCEALVILTDAIVLHGSLTSNSLTQLPTRVVSWILVELNKSVLQSKISLEACTRILRACLCALLRFFILESKGPDNKVLCAIYTVGSSSSRVISEFVPLLRLSMTICDQLDGLSDSSTRVYITQLLSTLLSGDQEISSSVIFEDINSLMKRDRSVGEFASIDVDKAVLVLFTHAGAKFFQANKSFRSTDWSYTSWTQMAQQYLIQSEHSYYVDRAKNNQQKGSLLFPDWIKTKNLFGQSFINKLTLQQTDAIMTSSQLSDLTSLLCDLFLDILVRHSSTIAVSKDTNSDNNSFLELDLIRCLDMIIEKKPISKYQSIPISCTRVFPIIEMYSRHIQALFGVKQGRSILAKLEVAIKHVLVFCEIAIEPRSKMSFLGKSQYATIWGIYCSIADEYSSRAIISLTLNVYKETGWAPCPNERTDSTVNQSNLSLTSISSHEVLDEQILLIRTSVLSYLCKLLSFRVDAMISPAEKSSLLNLLLQSLLKLCTDFCDGLLGESGGMRKSLFLLYAETIEKCIDNAAKIVDFMFIDSLHDCMLSLSALNEATMTVWNAFCKYSFKEAALVKSSLKICVEKLPSLVRKIEMIVGRRIDVNTQLMPCVVLLEQINMSLVAAKNTQISQTNNDNEKPPGSLENIEVMSIDVAQHPITQMIKPHFASANIATWALNIALVSLSNILNESNKVLMSSYQNKRLPTITSNDRLAFTKLRIDGFQSVHSSICKMFDIIVAHDDSVSAENATNESKKDCDAPIAKSAQTETVLVELLSNRGKSHLCSCLEKMTISLSLSIKTIVGYLNDSVSEVNARVCEAVLCILGCFSSMASQDSKSYDSITGPIRWFVAESKVENYSILGRLTKIIYRSESIQMELQNLCSIIRRLNKKSPNSTKERMQILNDMACTCTRKSPYELSFCDLLEQCVKIVQSRMSSLREITSTSGLFSGDGDSDSDEGEFTRGKRRRQARFVSRQRSRRMPLRSRNEWIDDWLTLDDEEFARTPGEVYNANDAYVDLEDFIVEG